MEKDIENKLCKKIQTNPADIIVEIDKNKLGFDNLIKSINFKIFQDNSEWNKDKTLMIDVIGGMTPDIVLRSIISDENRIYIEVKETSTLNYTKEDSQLIRYFLHLLATSSQQIKHDDLQRAILLAAPVSWFEQDNNKIVWDYFLEKYGDLAKAFDIVLGRIII